MKNYKELQKEIKLILNKYNLKAIKIDGNYELTGTSEILYKSINCKNLNDTLLFIINNMKFIKDYSIRLNEDQKIFKFLNWAKNKISNLYISRNNNFFTINKTYFKIRVLTYTKNNNGSEIFTIDTDLFLYQKIKMGLNYYHVDYLIKNNQLYNEDVKELFNLIELYKLNQKLENKLIKKNVATKTIKI